MTLSQANAMCANALTAALSCWGVSDVVLSPGSRSTPLVLACHQNKNLQLHVVLDERDAAFFALGMARVQRRAVVLVCTSGTAGAHYLPAIIEAHYSGEPLLVLTADRPVKLRHCGALQTIQQLGMFGQFVRFSAEAAQPQIGEAIPRSWQHLAMNALLASHTLPMSPVHLNLPFVEPLYQEEALLSLPPKPPTVIPSSTQMGADLAAQHWQDWAAAFDSGLFIVGPRPLDNFALAASLNKLAALLNWPIIAESTSQVRFHPASQPWLLPSGTWLLRQQLDLPAACIVQLGGSLLEKKAEQKLQQAQQVLRIDESMVLRDPWFTTTCFLQGNSAATLAALAEKLPATPRPITLLSAWQQASQQLQQRLEKLCLHHFFSGSIVRLTVASLPAASLLYIGNSLSSRDIDLFANQPQATAMPITVVSQRGVNGIDGSVAGFLGARQAWPNQQPAVGIIGDLTFFHNVGALLLAQQSKNLGPTVLIVIDNQGGGIFDTLPIKAADVYLPYFRLQHQWQVCRWAQAAHVDCEVVRNLKDFQQGLLRALQRFELSILVAVVGATAHIEASHILKEIE